MKRGPHPGVPPHSLQQAEVEPRGPAPSGARGCGTDTQHFTVAAGHHEGTQTSAHSSVQIHGLRPADECAPTKESAGPATHRPCMVSMSLFSTEPRSSTGHPASPFLPHLPVCRQQQTQPGLNSETPHTAEVVPKSDSKLSHLMPPLTRPPPTRGSSSLQAQPV